MSPQHDLPIFDKWLDFLKWLLPTTGKLPRRMRFTFADRIDTLTPDRVGDPVEARHSHRKQEILKRA
ncbi:MAG: four helix bundle protein, partial [Magnetococcales bacterium]|nr:four helix bundle protein [Magnetococcales bacterium]